MTTTVRFNDFKAPNPKQSRYGRKNYRIYDANTHYGDVRPFACPERKCDDHHQYLHPILDCECLGFDYKADVVKGFNNYQFFYLKDRRLHQALSYDLCNNNSTNLAGSPFNPTAPVAVATGCNDQQCEGAGVAYAITYVTRHAGIEVESSPSPPSDVVPIAGQSPMVSVTWTAAPSTDYDIVATRLYRVTTTFEDDGNIIAEGAEWTLVAEFSGSGSGSHNDYSATFGDRGMMLTYQPMAFPSPSDLVGLCRTADGIAVAQQHRLYISVTGQPQFTWDGVVEIEDEILDIQAIGNTIFVFTNHNPVKVTYRHGDDMMTIDREVIHRDLPLVSTRSVSVMGSKVYFASTHSLYEWDIGGYGADIRKVDVFTPEQWKNIQPDSVRGTAYEYGYMLSCDGLDVSLMIEETGKEYSVMPITYINGVDLATNTDGQIMYQGQDGVYLWDWRKTTCASFEIWDNIRPGNCEQCDCCPWFIELYFDNEGKNRFTKMRVEWDLQSYKDIDVTFKHNNFGEHSTMLGEAKITGCRGFSIPKYKSAQTFSVELTSCAIMHEVRFATSNQELTISSNATVG